MVGGCHPWGWRSIAFPGYVDLTQDVDRDMPRLLVGTDPVGSEEEKVHRRVMGPASDMRSIDGR